MKKYLVKYDLVAMNIIGTIYSAILGVLTYFLIKNGVGNFTNSISSNYLIFLGAFVLLYIFWAILHEIIHGLFYVIGGTKWDNIAFGAALEKGLFYCKCRFLISKKNALISLQAPLVIIGIITYIVSFFLGSYILLFLSILNIYGACGDIMMILFFLNLENDVKFMEIGDTSTFMLVTNEDLLNKKFCGIKEISLINDKDFLTDVNEKKIDISKMSYIFIIILIVFCIFDIVLGLLEH